MNKQFLAAVIAAMSFAALWPEEALRAQSVPDHDPYSTYLNNVTIQNMMRQQLLIQGAVRRRGREIIRTRRATTRFTPRTFPLQQWLLKWDKTNDPAKRRENTQSWREQKAMLDQEVKARGAKSNDVADMWAVCFVMAYEGYSGQRANNAQFKDLALSFRSALLKDETFQGQSSNDKQELVELNILDATYSLVTRRDGTKERDAKKLSEARQKGTFLINKWWRGGVQNLKVAPTKFVGR